MSNPATGVNQAARLHRKRRPVKKPQAGIEEANKKLAALAANLSIKNRY
jgi:hypothetical protein